MRLAQGLDLAHEALAKRSRARRLTRTSGGGQALSVPSARVLVIDNYDSFTYNLVQALGMLGARCDVALNDAIDVAEVRRRNPDAVLISPGPCSPDESGVSLDVIRAM